MSNSTQARSIDNDGSWYVNRSQFRMVNGDREGVWFEPGQPTRVKPDAWIATHVELGILVKVDDPFAVPEIEPIEPITPLDGGTAHLKEPSPTPAPTAAPKKK